MTSSFEEFVQNVKNSVDLVNVVGEYVDLKKTGKNYKGLCPFHQEKTPSFIINPLNQVYHCFGCGVGGDVFTFLMEMDHLTFKESLKIVARRAGMEMPSTSKYQKKLARQRERLFEINNLAAKFYNYLLLNKKIADQALDYLKKRGFNLEDVENFQLGYAPDRWQVLMDFLTSRGYQASELEKAGLLSKSKNKYFDKFRGRIIFPVRNVRGEVLAFGGRILDDNKKAPKYLNSPTTKIYDKGKNLYGIYRAKKEVSNSAKVIIMEGYTDVIRAHQVGVKNVVASLGTALTIEQARYLKRFADKTFIAFDSDIAGTKATLKGLEILKNEGLLVKVIKLPEDNDPDDFIKEKGRQGFKVLIDQALSLTDFKINQVLKNKKSEDNTEDKILIVKEMIKIISELKDPVERDIYIKKIADKFEIDADLLRKETGKLNKYNKKDKNNKKRYTKNNTQQENLPEINKLEKKILKVFIDFPEYRTDIKNMISPEFFSESIQEVVEFLWNNTDQDLHLLLKKENNKKLENIFINLAVEENNNINLSLLKGWINNLRQGIYYRKKRSIFQQLQEKEEITPVNLNELLKSFKEIDSKYRKEGVLNDK